MIYTIIDIKGNIFEIDNQIFKSEFLENSDVECCINVPVHVESYYFDQADKLTDLQLVNYIIFWDYLLSDIMISGVVEYINRKMNLFISDDINNFIKKCQDSSGDTFKHFLYFDLVKGNIKSFIKADNVKMLEYFYNKGYNLDQYWYVCNIAARGHLDCLRYLHQIGCQWDYETCNNASQGHLDCLKYLHENGCEWESAACDVAAEGHLDCLVYLHENGCEWDQWACRNAARGHLECLKYLHENGCPWDWSACTFAARGGHLECLKYLHENGCEWNSRACENAARGGHLDCLIYLHENGCEFI